MIPLESSRLFGEHKMPKVYIFLSETCPICQSSTLEIRRVREAFPRVEFIGLFPGKDSDNKSREKFAKKYRLDFPMQGDSLRKWTKELKATITPEVVVVGADQQVLYRGKIDNSFVSPGKKRTVVTEKYLYNALKAITLGENHQPASTQPVGCFIE
jgi:hypothetical protein